MIEPLRGGFFDCRCDLGHGFWDDAVDGGANDSMRPSGLVALSDRHAMEAVVGG